MLTKNFQQWYLAVLTPACLAMVVLAACRTLGVELLAEQAGRPVTMSLLVLAGVLAFALPLWLRILFCRTQTGKSGIGLDGFIVFEKRFILAGVLATYMVPLGYLCNLPQVPLFWIMLFALYAGYYYFPSQKRIDLEVKIFRVQGVG
ncbi:hypothetical protein [Desulfoplanes sp.]